MDQKYFSNEAKKILDSYEKIKCGVMTKAFTHGDDVRPFEGFEITQNGSKINTMPLGDFLFGLFRFVNEEEESYRSEIKQLKHDIEKLESEIKIHKEIRKELEAKIKKLNQPRMIKQMVVRSYQSLDEDGIQGKELARCLNNGWKVVCNNYVPVHEYNGRRIVCPAYIEYILEKEIEDEQQTESETL